MCVPSLGAAPRSLLGCPLPGLPRVPAPAHWPSPHPSPHPSPAPAALVRDLRELPSQAALALRSDAANVAAISGQQAATVERAAKRLAKEHGI